MSNYAGPRQRGFGIKRVIGLARKKYLNDYRVTQRMDAAGRVHTDYEYVGERYRYVLEPDALRREKKAALLLCLAGTICFILALLPHSAASHTIYITLPFVFAALPLGILIETLLTAPKGEEGLERRQADRLSNRWPAASMFVMLLSAVSLVGELIFALLGGTQSRGDAIFTVFAALLGVCGYFLFNKRRSFDTRND